MKNQHTTKSANVTEIRSGLSLLLEPGSVSELRVLGSGHGTVSGYFNDFEAMARCAAELSGKAEGVYFVLNPINPILLARSPNRMKQYSRSTTNDTDIERRRWLSIDFDPVRPAGISSTDEEHELAMDRARKVRDYLSSQGWPPGVLSDSGNGAHLVYRIDLPNDGEAGKTVEDSLKSLDLLFSDGQVSVDVTTFNAARIWKVYGTLARKGGNLEERPHRIAHIVDAPKAFEPVPIELLARLAAQVPKVRTQRSGARRADVDVDSWLATHGIEVAFSGPWQNHWKWVLQTCPFNADHTNRSAFIVLFSDGRIFAKCHHNSCSGKGWPELRDKFEPGWRKNGIAAEGENQYEQRENGIYWNRQTKDGLVSIRITNFGARIVSQIKEDDGAEVRRLFEIEAKVGDKVSRFPVAATEFASMNWALGQLGARAVVYAGHKERARDAIQLLSNDILERIVYVHTGWREIDGLLVFLHANGAICAEGLVNGIEVKFEEKLKRFALPSPPGGEECLEAVRASLSLRDLSSAAIVRINSRRHLSSPASSLF